MEDRCSHGIPWESDCDQCEAIGNSEQLKHIAEQAKHCAEYYERNPAMSVMAVPDIYRAIKRLADSLAKAENDSSDAACARIAQLEDELSSLRAQKAAVPHGYSSMQYACVVFRHKETGEFRYVLTGTDGPESDWDDVAVFTLDAAPQEPDQ